MKRFQTLCLLLAGLALASCGGGGGDPATPPAATAVTITGLNQQAVARAVVSGGSALMWTQPLAAPGRATALGAGTVRAATPVQLLAAVTSRTAWLVVAPGATARVRPLAVSTETEFCSYGGTVATSFDDRDGNNDASPGDVISAVFTGCKEDDLIRLDGRVTIQITTVAEVGTDGLDLAGSFRFEDVRAVVGDTTADLSGSVAASIALRGDSLGMTLTVGSDALRIAARAPGFDESLVYESGMAISITANDAGTITLALDGSFVSASLGGRVTVATLQPVRQLASDDYPNAGQFLVRGGSGSQLRVTVQDATQVRLELDAAGDGVFETTTPVVWSALLPISI